MGGTALTSTGAAPVFDASQFIIEPQDLWTKRVAARHKDAAPRVVAAPGGGEAWAFEGGAWLCRLGLDVCAGRSPTELRKSGLSYSTIRKGMFDPKERLKDMAAD